MALIFCDGFEDGTTAWTLTNSMAVGTGRFGSGIVAGLTTSYALGGFPPTTGPIIAGCAFKSTAAASAIMGFTGPSNVSHVLLTRGAGGELIAYRTASGSVIGSSAAGVLPAGAWSYIEAKVTIHDSTGSLIVRVNGIEVLNLINVDTKDTQTVTDSLRFGSSTFSTTVIGASWDDVYIADNTGSFNNDFLGELTVEHLRPAADDTVQWVGSDGNSTDNYALVDEAGVYVPSDYVESSTVGQRDLYTVTPSTRSVSAPVLAVMPVAVALKTEAGTRTLKLDIKEGSGGTVRSSSGLGIPSSFGEVRAVFDRKNDGTQWTVADVNNLRIGYEVAT
ncbi:MAG: hypothetical protein ABWX90_04135 [Candidatus Saccharimonadales bacterium]